MATEKKPGSTTLADLEKQRDALAEQHRQLEEQIRNARREEAKGVYETILAQLKNYAEFITPGQRKSLIAAMGGDNAAAEAGENAVVLRAEDYYYQLDSGHLAKKGGRTSKEFAAWAESEAGKAWRAENPGQDFPRYPNPNAKENIFPKTALRKPSTKKKA